MEAWEILILAGGFLGLLGVLTKSFLVLYVGIMIVIAGVLDLTKIKFEELKQEKR